MSTPTIEYCKLVNGVWQAVVLVPEGDAMPQLVARHMNDVLEGLEISPTDTNGQWTLRLPVPSEILTDGVQTVVIEHVDTGDVVGSFALIAGENESYDIRAELDLLRAELDLLKSVVSRALRD